MRVLHILDHSIPLHSGYTFRTRAILEHQRAMGWETLHLTSTKQGSTDEAVEQVDGLTFYRTQPSAGILARLPVINQLAGVGTLARRLADVIDEVKPDLLHAVTAPTIRVELMNIANDHDIPVCILEKPIAIQGEDYVAAGGTLVIPAGAVAATQATGGGPAARSDDMASVPAARHSAPSQPTSEPPIAPVGGKTTGGGRIRR